jgi:putative membrane protein
VHEKCGDAFWQGIAAKLAPQFKAGKFTEAIEEAVREVGELLAQHFPRQPGGENHLPDAIVRE